MGKGTVPRTLPSRVHDCLLVAYARSAPKTSALPYTGEPCCPAERGAGRRPGGHRLRIRRRQCCQPLGRKSSRSGTSWLESRGPVHIRRRQKSVASLKSRRSSASSTKTHLDGRLPRRVPHSDVLDVPAHEELASALLPLNHESGILLVRAPWQFFRDALERRDEFHIFRRLVSPEQPHVAVGCVPIESAERTRERFPP